MRVFFSGNEELARYHLPIVQSVANSFAERCKKAGLSQNAMAFSFNDTGAHASIQYVFGQLNVQISAPFTISEGGTITETLKSKRAIWIRTFDESVRYSYNGMFFSYHSSIEPIYEPSELKITSVEKKVITDEGARIVASWANRGSVEFNRYIAPYGINAAFAECSYEPDYGSSPLTHEIVVDGYSYGYPACAFYVPRANEIHWQSGGDAVFKEEFPVTAGVDTLDTMMAFPFFVIDDAGYPSEGCHSATYLLGPDFESFIADYKSKIAPFTDDMDGALIELFHTATPGAIPLTNTNAYFVSEYTMFYYTGTPGTGLTINEVPDSCERYEPNAPRVCMLEIDIAAGEGASVVINMVDVDGTLISDTLPATIIPAKSFNANYSHFSTDGGDKTYIVHTIAHGAAIPTSISGAPRGHILLGFRDGSPYLYGGMVFKTLAYTKQTGWKECIPIGGYSTDVFTPAIRKMWIGPYADVCIKYVFSSYLTLDYLKKTFDPVQDKFSYNSLLKIGMSVTTSQSVVIFSENGRYVSLYNCQTYPNGIYDIITGNFNQVHLYDETEIEPIFMDDVAGVICTKRAIYLDHGARSLLCTECCGMFLDHTHYVDKLADGSFVLNKIVEGDSGLVGVMVDSLPAGAYNFYEFSEDASVCIISNYYLDPKAPQPSSPAIVLDYADPVYRFEPSDQTIIQYMRPALYEPTEENKYLGYPTGIPFGVRYVNICTCYPEGVPKREHFVYCCPKNGETITEATIDAYGNSSFCPLQSGEKISYREKFPTIVPQYSTAVMNRRDYRYNEKRLNRHIYHHTGKILRRISEKLEPIDVELETTITRNV